MSKWRCVRCETLNDENRSSCIVCDLAKTVKKDISKSRTNLCAMPGCSNVVIKKGDYCEKHKNTVCPMCKKELKLDGEDFCYYCMQKIIKESTGKLRLANKILTIVSVIMAVIFVVLLVIKLLN